MFLIKSGPSFFPLTPCLLHAQRWTVTAQDLSWMWHLNVIIQVIWNVLTAKNSSDDLVWVKKPLNMEMISFTSYLTLSLNRPLSWWFAHLFYSKSQEPHRKPTSLRSLISSRVYFTLKQTLVNPFYIPERICVFNKMPNDET